MKVIVVGEAPGRLVPGGSPLTGAIGFQICELAGIEYEYYLRRTLRVNVFDEPVRKWDATRATTEAASILSLAEEAQRVVLLGRKVQRAFVVPGPWYEWTTIELPWKRGFANVVCLPHPSGRNRTLNDQEQRDRFGVCFASALLD